MKKIAIVSGGSIQRVFASGFLSDYQPDRIIAADRGLAFCLENGFFPDLAVGDFDSLPEGYGLLLQEAEGSDETDLQQRINSPTLVHELMAGISGNPGPKDSLEIDHILQILGKAIRVVRHRPEKDATDTELAVEQAILHGADEVMLLGATGTRLDHVWGNLSLLYRLHSRGIRAAIVDEWNRISMLTGCSDSQPGASEKQMGGKQILIREEQFGHYVSIMPYGGPVTGLTLTGFKYPLCNHTLTPGTESLCVSNEILDDQAEIFWKSGVPVLVESRD